MYKEVFGGLEYLDIFQDGDQLVVAELTEVFRETRRCYELDGPGFTTCIQPISRFLLSPHQQPNLVLCFQFVTFF